MRVWPVAKVFRCFCWIILVLSLPTFSDRIPDRSKEASKARRLLAGHVEGWKLPHGGRERLTVPDVSLERAEAEQVVKRSGPVITAAETANPVETVSILGAGPAESRILHTIENWSKPRAAYPGIAAGLSKQEEPAQWWPVESVLELRSGLESELLQLQKGYELAFHNLFADLSLSFMPSRDNFLDNPFEEAPRRWSKKPIRSRLTGRVLPKTEHPSQVVCLPRFPVPPMARKRRKKTNPPIFWWSPT